MGRNTLEISLYGACVVRVCGKSSREVAGNKRKALIALLATAPFGRRSRAFLQNTLWGNACFDGGRQSLRRALSDLRQIFGPSFEQFFDTNNTEIAIRLDQVTFLTGPADGTFLEGIDIKETAFNEWLTARRLAPVKTTGLAEISEPVPPIELAPVIAAIPFQLV